MADRTTVIEFDEYPGEYVVDVSIPLDEYLAALELIDQPATPENIRKVRDLVERVKVDYPKPVAKMSHDLILGLALAWSRAVAEVPLPLRRRSSDGEPSEDRSPES